MKILHMTSWHRAMIWAVELALLCSLQPTATLHSEPSPLMIYCAAALKPALDQVAQQYQHDYGITIQAQYGASGTLLTNAKVTRQGDLYLPADESYIALANTGGTKLIKQTIPLVYMTPVIMVKKGNPLGIRSVNDLIKRHNIRIAYANPDAASIGKISREALEKSKQWKAFEPRITVTLPTVSDVANAVKLGTVDAGIVWDAVAKQYPEATAVHDKVLDHAKQRVVIGVLTSSHQSAAAWRFARYLGASDKGLRIFHHLGYEVVKGSKWKP